MRFVKTYEADIPALSRLWAQTFGDTEAEIGRFFQTLFPHVSGFAAKDGETLCAMCFALPQQLVRGEETFCAAYLYAAAVDAQYRGQGLCRKLLAFAEKELKKRNVACLLLVPADDGLAKMYEKLGFSGAFPETVRADTPPAAGQAQKLDRISYAGLRETLLWDVAHVRYPKPQLDYLAQEYEFYALRLGAASGCAAVRRKEAGRARVEELLPERGLLSALVGALGEDAPLLPELPHVMCRWLMAEPTGFSSVYLAFDFS